jgi:HupE / UreJ protein
MLRAFAAALIFVASALPPAAAAHSASTAYLEVDASAANVPTLQWRIPLRDLDALLNLDANGDERLSWGEVADRATDINALAATAMTVSDGTSPCTMRFDAPRFVRVADTSYAHLDAVVACGAGNTVTIGYRLFEGVDPSHRALVSMQGESQPRVVAPGATIDIPQAGMTENASSGFSGFLLSGIAHIAGGFDHLLFLLTLLLPVLVQRRSGRWVPRDHVQGAFWDVVWIATAFTIAHSITLALATFDVIRIPPRVIEPLIALTIVVTAVNNVWPIVTRKLAAVAFAFGLIHGFGFAEVLTPLALPRFEMATALLGFNLGVELGQLAIVAVAFFGLASLRRWPGYPRWILVLGSLLIAVVAVLWFVERVFDVSILSV